VTSDYRSEDVNGIEIRRFMTELKVTGLTHQTPDGGGRSVLQRPTFSRSETKSTLTSFPGRSRQRGKILEVEAVTRMATILHPISQEERAKRERDYRQAVASLRLEGLAPGAEANAIFQRYVDGQLTLDQMGAEIDKLHERRLGPLRLSGD
jgi:Antitoxin VbhA